MKKKKPLLLSFIILATFLIIGIAVYEGNLALSKVRASNGLTGGLTSNNSDSLKRPDRQKKSSATKKPPVKTIDGKEEADSTVTH